MQEIVPNVRVVDWKAVVNLSVEDAERMKSDPAAMYLHSLRIHSKLPGELHEAMLLHAFDPESSHYVKSYLNWLHACQENDERISSARRRDKLMEHFIMITTVLSSMTYFGVLYWLFTK